MARSSRIVKMGVVDMSSDTLDANVIPRAVFSVRKYYDPPVSPPITISNSSLRLSDHRRRMIGSIQI